MDMIVIPSISGAILLAFIVFRFFPSTRFWRTEETASEATPEDVPSEDKPPEDESSGGVYDPEGLPDDIPHRKILVRNQITPRKLIDRLVSETVSGKDAFYEDINQIGEVRGGEIREWAYAHKSYGNVLKRHTFRQK
jgi:hypothetical protein